MDSRYIITPTGNFISEDELYHWGIKGMKWGVRRYQNADGSLTAAGRKRYTNSDGSLNEKGKKYYAKEAERLKAERKTLRTRQQTEAKLSKLDTMRQENARLKSGKNESEPAKKEQISDMSDNDLQQRVNRLRNENAYRVLSKELGYDGPKTELDALIADMEKQKRYLELQRDINNLTPKKVSKGKQLVEKVFNKVIEPAATEAGKKFLSQYISDAAAKALKKEADKTTEKVEKTIDKEKTKQAKKEAKQEARQEAKQSRKEARQEAKKAEKSAGTERAEEYRKAQSSNEQSKVYEGTVEGTAKSHKTTSSTSNSKKSNTILDSDKVYKGSDGYYHYGDRTVTSLSTIRNTSTGSNWVSRYYDTPISGLLPAPKDDDD